MRDSGPCLRPDGKPASGACSAPGREPVRAAARTPETSAFFAIGLIAAKPVKPCDGGVFGALDLLSKKEWNAPDAIHVWLACSCSRPRFGQALKLRMAA